MIQTFIQANQASVSQKRKGMRLLAPKNTMFWNPTQNESGNHDENIPNLYNASYLRICEAKALQILFVVATNGE